MNKSELTNFLDCGAILQLGLDQYKLIWGPFTAKPFDSVVISDEKTIIYKPDFWDFTTDDQAQNTAFTGVSERVVERSDLLELLGQQEQVDFNINWGAVTEADFVEQFQWSQSQFHSKELSKTVPIISQTGRFHFSKVHLAKALRTLLGEKHYGSTYGFWQNGEGYLGHTPELILNWESSDHTLKTMALAGTMDSRKESTEAILHDKKILDEHQFVVNDILDVLKKADPAKKVEVEKTKVLELKYLCHLQTQMQIVDVNATETRKYMNAIHPTAALGLYPRKLEAYEKFKKFSIQKARENFAAPFAFINANQVKAIAAIRLFYFTQATVKITSGCGVTTGSVLVDELKELENKRNSVKRMMGMNL